MTARSKKELDSRERVSKAKRLCSTSFDGLTNEECHDVVAWLTVVYNVHLSQSHPHLIHGYENTMTGK